MTNGGERLGGFWRRLLAYAIDKLILYLFSLLLFLSGLAALALGAGASFARGAAAGGVPDGLGFITSAVLTLLGGRSHVTWLHAVAFAGLYTLATSIAAMAYFTWFHGAGGRTPGKMLLGLRVVRISGEPLGFGIAFLRWVGYIVSTLPLWLGFLWIALDGKKQGWHDKIAATLVIRTDCKPDTDPAAGKETSFGPVPPALPRDHAADGAPLPLSRDEDTPVPTRGAAPSGGPEPPPDPGPGRAPEEG